jgi:hypothetical protein
MLAPDPEMPAHLFDDRRVAGKRERAGNGFFERAFEPRQQFTIACRANGNAEVLRQRRMGSVHEA